MYPSFLQSLFDAFTQALVSLAQGSAILIPRIFIAIVFLAIGWVFAALIEKLIETVFKAFKVDAALKSAGIEEVVKRSGHDLNSGLFFGSIIKWFIILAFLIGAFDALGLSGVSQFLVSVLDYLPHVIVAILIMMAAVIVANTMQKIVVASAHAAHVSSAELLGRITKWAIWIFALLIALPNLGVDLGIILTVVQLLFAGIALAIGIAFGLGGKDAAQRIIDKTAHTVLEK